MTDHDDAARIATEAGHLLMDLRRQAESGALAADRLKDEGDRRSHELIMRRLAETHPDAIWPAQAQRALRGLIKAWHKAREQGLAAIPAATADPLITEFRRAVTVGLSKVPRIPGPKHSTAQHPGRDLLEFCRYREDDVLRFSHDTRIWPTNNISERGVRPLKTQQKISGRLASDDVTQDRLDIRSYIDTARKHGRNAMDVLHDLMLGRPWRPPAQAFSP